MPSYKAFDEKKCIKKKQFGNTRLIMNNSDFRCDCVNLIMNIAKLGETIYEAFSHF